MRPGRLAPIGLVPAAGCTLERRAGRPRLWPQVVPAVVSSRRWRCPSLSLLSPVPRGSSGAPSPRAGRLKTRRQPRPRCASAGISPRRLASRLFRPTGAGAFPPPARLRQPRNLPPPPKCTSFPGAHRNSTDASVRAMHSRSPSPSNRSATGQRRSGKMPGRNSSLTPCTRPGLRLPPMETAVGRSTILAAGQPCASMQHRRW